MDFLIVTGMSGAGKTNALHSLEDIGFYCVDNIPTKLVPTFYDLCQKSSDQRMKRVAVVVDIRGESFTDGSFRSVELLKDNDKNYKILFLDSRDNVLVRRYKETRRKHPLAETYNGSIQNAIRFERKLLSAVKNSSDYLIDTSFLSSAQLKKRLSSLFLSDSSDALMITCMSFGFKYGAPTEADLVFDVRCLPNPYYVEELRNLTGLDDSVKNYVMEKEQTKGFVLRLVSLVDYMLPLYCNEGKSQLVIAIGCTGGHHRSVALTQFLYNHLLDANHHTLVNHRDINKI